MNTINIVFIIIISSSCCSIITIIIISDFSKFTTITLFPKLEIFIFPTQTTDISLSDVWVCDLLKTFL